MDRRKNFLWLVAGILIGSLGLILVASLTSGGGRIGSAQAAQTHRPNVMGVLAVRQMRAAPQEAGGGASQKPNILFIMGDDIGWMQPSIYHRGLMVGETPNIDRIGREGAIFMDYVAMQSCTSGRKPSSPACIRCAPGWSRRNCPGAHPICVRARRHSPCSCTISAILPGSSARTTWATTLPLYRRRTVSRSIGATFTTWMRRSV